MIAASMSRKRFIGAAFTLCALGITALPLSGAEPSRNLIGVLSPRPQNDFVCPCEFDLGTKIDGEVGLIIDRNGEEQRAFANIGGSVLELKNTVRFESTCAAGKLVTASWSFGDVDLKIRVLTGGEGEESCWYRGLLTVTRGDRGATRKIVGACGC
jgi:hypothetical protein